MIEWDKVSRFAKTSAEIMAILRRMPQYLVAIVLLISVIGKLIDDSSFQNFLITAGFSPSTIVLARILTPLLEFMLAASLLLDLFPIQANITTAVVLFSYSVFFFVIVQTKGYQSACGCFGEIIKIHSPVGELMMNLILIALTFIQIKILERTKPPLRQ
jgi:uncharacterized membrane protein YphA (DoxX/SURF4 family)